MKDFQPKVDKKFLMKRMGSLTQLAGAKRYELTDGRAKGVEAVDIRTGGGLQFTVLPGRGMDIAWADYKGVPICYMSKTGIVSPQYYEAAGMSWLRNFFGGLLTTCGLCHVGGPYEEDNPVIGKIAHGLHGRICNMAAKNVCVKEEWVEGEYIMSVSGRMRESIVHVENMAISREISAKLGENKLILRDVVENEGFLAQTLMVLYHINLGYPLLDEGSRMICNSYGIEPSDALSEKNIGQYGIVGAPVNGARENVYFHDLKTDKKGNTAVGLVNDALELGIYIKFNKQHLPRLTQWKMLNEAEYVLGIEPANCLPSDRTTQSEQRKLDILQPGEQRVFELEIGLLENVEQITSFENQVSQLGGTV